METDKAKAERLLNQQLKELESVRGLTYKDPIFLGWRDTAISLLQRFLPPDSPHLARFKNLAFTSRVSRKQRWGSPPKPLGYISPRDQEHYRAECRTADATIRAALKHIEEFGIHTEQSAIQPDTKRHSGGVQNFYGNVTIQNQAIATGNAIQNIDHLGDTTGADLKAIADLLIESQDLTPRQVNEGLAGIEGLAVEIQKPDDKKNWKTVLDYGKVVLIIADKATDLAQKLMPYTPAILTLMEKARHMI